MADAHEVDLTYGSFIVLGKPVLFWLRWGGLAIALFEGIVEALNNPGTHHFKFDLLLSTKIVGACVYGYLFVRNVPSRIDLNPNREYRLLCQILLGVVLSLDLTNLSMFCIPFCVRQDRRFRWCGIALGADFLGWVSRWIIYRNVMNPPLNQLIHSPGRLLVMFIVFCANHVWYGFSFLGACLLFEVANRQLQLSVANRELVELQMEIKEAAKYEERFRLSRELHDAVGHYLTSLSIQLEIAQHRAAHEALPAIRRAQIIARVLLAEIRESVSVWRDDERNDLTSALRLLLRDVPGVHVQFETLGEMPQFSAIVSHGLYRCVQEAVTNVLRHSAAKNLRVQLARHGSSILLSITDDGRGCSQLNKGDGLNGIHSRAKEMGGTVSISTAEAKGFALCVTIPAGEGRTV